MMNNKELYDINLQLLDKLNNFDIKSEFDKKRYYIIFNFIYDFFCSEYYKLSCDIALKNKLFDIIVEMLLSAKYQAKISPMIYKGFLHRVANGKYYDTILKYYKNYDYLNKNKTLIKILVSYIQPSFLFKSSILTPIHLGRAVEKESSKDGIISENDVKWLHENCIGDDDFEENISKINRRVGFFTGTYWAWKNYEKLGNPEYFGSFGYRRLLFPNCLNNIENYDFILHLKKEQNETIKSHTTRYHGKLLYQIMIELVEHIYPQEIQDVEKYFNEKESYFLEMYIMKKDIFFNYCEWIYNILLYLIKKYPNVNLSNNAQNSDKRDIAFIIEILTGYYLLKLTKNTKYKFKEVATFEPFFPALQLKHKIKVEMNNANISNNTCL